MAVYNGRYAVLAESNSDHEAEAPVAAAAVVATPTIEASKLKTPHRHGLRLSARASTLGILTFKKYLSQTVRPD